jgi:predicted dienelactone hydrolase
MVGINMNNHQQVVSQAQKEAVRPSRSKKIVKWTGIVVLVFVSLVGVLIGTLYGTALRSEHPVGFQTVKAIDSDGKPFAIGIWYPTSSPSSAMWAGNFFMHVASAGAIAGNKLPLVVVPHGTGGGLTSHADLALALASAGHVVAAPMHSDNFQDMSSVGSPAYLTGRTRQLRATLDHMLTKWQGHGQIDAERIGAYGFSIGAFTVLTAAGATPDLRGVAKYCASSSEFACDMLRQSNSFLLNAELPAGSDQFEQDPRIKAVVVAAPGLGFRFNRPDALSKLSAPVQLWHGDKDDNVPYATNAKLIRDALGTKVDFHSVPDAAHFSFLVPCGVLKIPPICKDPASFDRAAFHQAMNKDVSAFFAKAMPKS